MFHRPLFIALFQIFNIVVRPDSFILKVQTQSAGCSRDDFTCAGCRRDFTLLAACVEQLVPFLPPARPVHGSLNPPTSAPELQLLRCPPHPLSLPAAPRPPWPAWSWRMGPPSGASCSGHVCRWRVKLVRAPQLDTHTLILLLQLLQNPHSLPPPPDNQHGPDVQPGFRALPPSDTLLISSHTPTHPFTRVHVLLLTPRVIVFDAGDQIRCSSGLSNTLISAE